MFCSANVYAGVPAHWIMNGTSTVPELTSTWYALSVNHCGFSRRPQTAGPRKAYGSATRKAKNARDERDAECRHAVEKLQRRRTPAARTDEHQAEDGQQQQRR